MYGGRVKDKSETSKMNFVFGLDLMNDVFREWMSSTKGHDLLLGLN